MKRETRFLVDAMLGNIVTWLRILGYDSVYWNGDDGGLITIASRENRIILTKDRLLYSLARKHGLEVVFVEDSRVEAMLSKLSKEYGISLEFDPRETRCPVCNSLLKMKESKSGSEWTCINCDKHYWMGSHWKNISKIFEEAKKIGGEA